MRAAARRRATRTRWARVASGLACGAMLVAGATSAAAQTLTYRGFAEATAQLFPQDTPTDETRAIGAVLVRVEPALRLSPWARLRGAFDARTDTRRYVERAWRVDWQDRRALRPAFSLRQGQLTLARGAYSLDVGKQFVRWGKTDILTPTDRFAPRDVLEVVEDDFLAITAIRGQVANDTTSVDLVYTPRFTGSRVPLLDSRWTVLPPSALAADIRVSPADHPNGPQLGARLNHIGSGFEVAVAAFSGYNHLPLPRTIVLPPNVEMPATAASRPQVLVTSTFPAIQMLGADVVVPLRWVNVKAESAFLRSRDGRTDDFLLYVVQLERQSGELSAVLGYAGQYVTRDRPGQEFGVDRGLTDAFIGRIGYTLDATRSVAVEAAVRQNLDGLWLRPEYSHAFGAHVRLTVNGHLVRGDTDDFIGQFRRNALVAATMRWSF